MIDFDGKDFFPLRLIEKRKIKLRKRMLKPKRDHPDHGMRGGQVRTGRIGLFSAG